MLKDLIIKEIMKIDPHHDIGYFNLIVLEVVSDTVKSGKLDPKRGLKSS